MEECLNSICVLWFWQNEDKTDILFPILIISHNKSGLSAHTLTFLNNIFFLDLVKTLLVICHFAFENYGLLFQMNIYRIIFPFKPSRIFNMVILFCFLKRGWKTLLGTTFW